MAHYALIDANNIVVQVITGVDENTTQIDTDGTLVGGSTENWEAFYANLPWFAGLTCKRTSYNSNGAVHKNGGTAYRGNFAVVGGTYDLAKDAFISPKSFDSFILDENTYQWVPPVPKPDEGKWYWNEEIVAWSKVDDVV
jgi:hypothetical protein